MNLEDKQRNSSSVQGQPHDDEADGHDDREGASLCHHLRALIYSFNGSLKFKHQHLFQHKEITLYFVYFQN